MRVDTAWEKTPIAEEGIVRSVTVGVFKTKKVSLRWHRKKFVHTYISLQEAIQNFESRSS
jgi:hypothetical protein